MLKKTVQYETWDGEPAEKTLYFNLTRPELMDNLDLEDELQDLQRMFGDGAENRTLSKDEIQKILNLFKRIAKLAYGERDGDRFRKNDELWEAFTESAVYDNFLYNMFSNPDEAIEFMSGVLPKNLRAEVEKQIEAGEIPQLVETKELPEKSDEPKKPQDMSREELLAAMRERNQG